MSIQQLIEMLCEESGETVPENLSVQQQTDYFRALCNVRPPMPVSEGFLALQDEYLAAKTRERGVVDVGDLEYRDGIALWQGDITRLNGDAIVNACNSALLGCFQPLHNCIDNIIHSHAGVQVRQDCQEIMQGAQLPNGEVVATPAYNLPSRYIFHTVGPIVQHGQPMPQQEEELEKCYRSSIEKAVGMGLETLVFCCVSTGVYGYPKDLAASLAVKTVKACLPDAPNLNVIFNVFLDEDRRHYERELSDQTAANA